MIRIPGNGGRPPLNIVGFTRPQFLGDVPFAANAERTLPGRGGVISFNDFFLYGMILEVEGRLAVGTAAATAELADSPYSVVDEVRIEGVHQVRQQSEVFYRLRGPDIRELALIYGSRAPGTTGALGVGTGNKDFRFFLPIVFPPEKIPMLQQLGYLLDGPNYRDLILTVKWADGPNVLTPDATTTFTFTAFGSATGSPRARVLGILATFGKGGPPRGFVPARVWRSYAENTSAIMTATGTDQRIADVRRGHIIRSMLFKTGVKATGVTAGNNAYASLSNAILANVRVNRGSNRPIRLYPSYTGLREYGAWSNALALDTGFALIDFAENGDVNTAWNTRDLVTGPDGDVDTFIQGDVTGAANQAALSVTQEIRGVPILR